MLARILGGVVSIVTLGFSSTAGAQVVDFDEFAGTTNPQFGSVEVEGHRLQSNHAHVIGNFFAAAPLAQNSSPAYIAHEGGTLGQEVTLARLDGAAFSLVALEVAELWVTPVSGFPNATEVELVGQLAGGGTTTLVLPLDGLIDGAGGVEDFQNVHLDGFDGLLSVTIDGLSGGLAPFAIAFDDVAVLTAPWGNLGSGLAGARGIPALVGSGPLAANSPVTVELTNAAPAVTGTLFVSAEPRPIPFAGGVLQAWPPIASIPFVTDAQGELVIRGTPPIDLFQSGLRVVLQAAVADTTGPQGFALSNAIEVTMGAVQAAVGTGTLVASPLLSGGSANDPLGGSASTKGPIGIH